MIDWHDTRQPYITNLNCRNRRQFETLKYASTPLYICLISEFPLTIVRNEKKIYKNVLINFTYL